MDLDTLMVMYWYHRRSKPKVTRRYWVRPGGRSQYLGGSEDQFREDSFQKLMGDLRKDEKKFHKYFRMSIATFDYLLERFDKDLRKQDTSMRKAISPEEKLAISLRYLASGCSFTELHRTFQIGLSTISKILKKVTKCICSLHNEFMPLPNKLSEWEKISQDFENKAKFPHCIGAVDGKQIRLKKTNRCDSNINKDINSILLLGVVDTNHRFLYISVRPFGRNTDSTLFRESDFWRTLEDGSLKIPQPSPLTAESKQKVPYVILGDEGFCLNDNLLRPFSGAHLDKSKQIYNYRLTQARKFVDNTFRLLACKWRILLRPLDVKQDTAVWVVKACVILYNLIREKEGLKINSKFLRQFNLENLPKEDKIRGGRTANTLRNEFMNYFMSEVGSIPEQEEVVKDKHG